MFGVNNPSTGTTTFGTGGSVFGGGLNINKPQSTTGSIFGAGTTNIGGGMMANKPPGGIGTTTGFGTSTGTMSGFGASTSTTGMFPTTSTSTTGMFPTTSTSTTGMFPTTSTSNTGMFAPTSTSTTSNIMTQNKPMSGFTGQTGFMTTTQVPQTQIAQQGGIMSMNQMQRSTGPQVFSLLPTNYLKYEKVEVLAEDIKNFIKQIETTFRQNEVKLNHTQALIEGLFDSYKTLNGEGVKLVKNCKLINSKKSKINFIIQDLKSDKNQQEVLLEKERRNYHILIEQPSMKIQVPSDYFVTLTKELEEKIVSQTQQISDIEALVNLHYRKEHGSFKVNSDLVEETIKEIYTCLIGLVTEVTKINDYVNLVKQSYIEMMKFTYGWKDFEIENRIKQFIQSTQDQTENTMRDRGMNI
jgi:hypothetical protein